MDQSVAGILRGRPEEADTATPRAPRSLSSTPLGSIAIGFASLSIWLGLWQAASTYEWSFFFRFDNIPAPTEVAAAVGELVSSPKFGAHVLIFGRRHCSKGRQHFGVEHV